MANRNIRAHEQVLEAQQLLIDGVPGAELHRFASHMNAQVINCPACPVHIPLADLTGGRVGGNWQHFSEVVEERVLSLGVCGFPACTAAIPQVKTGKLALVHSKREVYETVQPLYCSGACARAAQHFTAMLPETPVVIMSDSTPVAAETSPAQPEEPQKPRAQEPPEPEPEPEPQPPLSHPNGEEQRGGLEIHERGRSGPPALPPTPAVESDEPAEMQLVDTDDANLPGEPPPPDTKKRKSLGNRHDAVIPQVSPFLGTYYTLQQWCALH